MSGSAAGRLPRDTALFLAVAAAALGAGALAPRADEGVLAVLLGVAVAAVGLPHGALDAWIARRAALWRTARGAVYFHLAYVGLAAGVVAAWLAAPALCLTLFLALSAWHFAGDWRLPAALRPVVGAALLAFPAWAAPDEVARVFVALAGAGGASVAAALAAVAPALAVGAAAIAIGQRHRAPWLTAELTALGLLAAWLPPLAYFVVYFCALHSPRHFGAAIAGVAGPARRRALLVAVVYTVLALAGAAVAWPWIAGADAAGWDEDTVRMVFIGLAALTVPHMLVVAAAARHDGARGWA